MLLGGYYTLRDGLEQCKECYSTAIDTQEEECQFAKVTSSLIIGLMQTYFRIEIDVKIDFDFVTADEMAKLDGKIFIPTPNFDGRTLGRAVKNHYGYSIYIEEGTPERFAIMNFVHELAHIWQYLNWNEDEIKAEYGEEDHKLVYEGMATWVQIQFLLLTKYDQYIDLARQNEKSELMREDAYGWGLYNFKAKYPFVDAPEELSKTPFNTKIWPEVDSKWPIEKPLMKPKN